MRARFMGGRPPRPVFLPFLAAVAARSGSAGPEPTPLCHPAGACGHGPGRRALPAPHDAPGAPPASPFPGGPFGPGMMWEARGDEPGGFGGGPFGVRRPLRFLAEKLGLNEAQVKEMARILDELKTERAQSEVNRRRTLAAFADAVNGATFDEARAAAGADLRLEDARRLREAVLGALRRIHALLDATQREQLAYMIRTGTLVL